jgi:hypothetical protein
MSCIFFNPFTSKKAFALVFCSLVALFCKIESAIAEDMKITGHFYVAQDAENKEYTNVIQWEITNTGEWSKFLENLKTLPKDTEKYNITDMKKENPMGLRQPEVIHFNIVNSDLRTGSNIFISQAGIQQFSKTPTDVYFRISGHFRDFLETELKLNSSYDKAKEDIDINQPGIVVIYQGSKDFRNPSWVIEPKDKIVLETYDRIIRNLREATIFSYEQLETMAKPMEGEDTFILYLNYKDAPFDIFVMGKDTTSRGTKVVSEQNYYQDTAGYFSIFKRQAEDSLKATNKSFEVAPEEIRKRQALEGSLF